VKRRIVAAVAASLATLLGVGSARAAESAAAPGPIVVDPGHGGNDFGAKGVGDVLEKDLTLAIARKLAAELRARKLPVLLTRDSDIFIALPERTAIANRAHGRLFVSIHANSAPEPEVFGAETYFLSLESSDAEAKRVALTENDVYGQAGTASDSRDVVGSVLGDLIRTEHLRESSELAASIQHALAKLPGESRGVKQAPFVVLTGVNMPAALVEIGFVTNATEVKRLAQRDAQKALAKAIAAALVDAMGQNRALEVSGDVPR
jgi:N-acetylmuramoyl-L-alanine amidase